MSEYRFEDIAINSTEKKKPVEEDKYHYLGLEHLDSGTFTVSRFGSEVAPIGDKLVMKNGTTLLLRHNANMLKELYSGVDYNGSVIKADVKIHDDTKTVERNVDNRIYMISGQNLNIAVNALQII